MDKVVYEVDTYLRSWKFFSGKKHFPKSGYIFFISSKIESSFRAASNSSSNIEAKVVNG